MPILDVEIVCDAAEQLPSGLPGAIADAAGEVFSSRPQGTWVRLHRLSAADYAENGGGPAPGVRPVFVWVVKRLNQERDALASEARALAAAVARATGRPMENIHILFEPQGAGRIAFGGELVT